MAKKKAAKKEPKPVQLNAVQRSTLAKSWERIQQLRQHPAVVQAAEAEQGFKAMIAALGGENAVAHIDGDGSVEIRRGGD